MKWIKKMFGIRTGWIEIDLDSALKKAYPPQVVD